MRIIEIHIYGYGKLENYHISSMERLQVFFGENEAGKSTIMSFIHSVLFGFPARQSPDLRYEPKDNSKYGGKIKAFFPDKGIAVIERVKGKAAGDVTVSLENGTIGGEELLKDLLQRMDKSIFQAIFSFNVHGLQNIQSMKGEELGKYLFSAGTLGTDKLFNAETVLIKEMDQRFKPSGKKPLLNEKLRELKDVQVSLKNAEQQNERYAQLLAEKESIETLIVKLEAEITEVELRGVKLKEFKRSEHLVIEEAALRKRLDEYGASLFPQDGLYRFEKLDQELKPIQARLLWINDKRISLRQEAESCQHNSDLLDMETEISSKIENLPLYDQLKQEKRLLELKIEEITEEISQINDNLHTEFNEEDIQEINTSVFMKEQAENIQHHQQRLHEKKLELEAVFEEEKAVLVELEAHASAMETEMLAEEQRVQITKDLALFENKEAVQSDLNQVKEQIFAQKARAQNEEIRRNGQKKKDLYQLLLVGSVFLILFFLGLMNGLWGIAVVGIIGVLLLTVLYYKSASDSSKQMADEVLSELQEREQSLTELLNKQPAGNLFSIKSLLLKDEDLRQRHRELLVKIQQQSLRYEKVIQQFEKWEGEDASLKSNKAELIEMLGLKEEVGHTKIFDAYLLIEKQKQYFRERKRAKERLSSVTVALEQMDKGLTMLAERFLQNTSLSPVETATLLKRKLREAIEQQAKYHGIVVKLEELDEESTVLEKDLLLLTEEREGLLAQAEAADEDQFRIQAQRAEQIKNWSARLEDLNHQMAISGITFEEKEEILLGAALEDQMDENARLVEQNKKQLSNQFDRLAHVKHSMNVLEEGGVYSELLHKYKQLKHEFGEDAKEWARYAIARDLLSKTIERYKDERMPKMLAKAESFLSFLTDGSYIRIIPQIAGSGFLIERKDHVLFEANELSQATAEQVYVSIRLALAAVHFERYPFPIIIDDSFVNFDYKRTTRMIELLRKFSNNQILLFTCHRHLLEQFSEAEILQLDEKSTKIV